MGLLRAFAGALGGVLADQWKDYYYCDALAADILVQRGRKRISSRSSNFRGNSNIISDGSVIAVADGQCMMIVEQGKIIEVCAEPGEFIYNSSTEPSLFTGKLDRTLIGDVFKNIGRRFTAGGEAARDQRIYYFNTKEFVGNCYGTPAPVPFRVVDQNIGLDIDITIRCFGEYSYRITNPLLFYVNVCGNVEDTYTRELIDGQLKSELLTSLQPAFAEISRLGIRYSALPGHTAELADSLNRILSDKWKNTRGIEIASLGISSLKASEKDEEIIKELQRNATFRDPTMAAAQLVNAQSIAMQEAARNQSAGSAMAFMGMNMAMQAGGINAQSLYQMSASKHAQDNFSSSQSETWKCKCGNSAVGKFCSNCGEQKPLADTNSWTCRCGANNTGRFCSNCGQKKPVTSVSRCIKCGWQPAENSGFVRFCPNCGEAFTNDN